MGLVLGIKQPQKPQVEGCVRQGGWVFPEARDLGTGATRLWGQKVCPFMGTNPWHRVLADGRTGGVWGAPGSPVPRSFTVLGMVKTMGLLLRACRGRLKEASTHSGDMRCFLVLPWGSQTSLCLPTVQG